MTPSRLHTTLLAIIALIAVYLMSADLVRHWARPEEPAITGSQAQRIISELAEIRNSLAQTTAGGAGGGLPKEREEPSESYQPVSVGIKDQPGEGNPDAAVTMVVFTDYECPFCKRFHENTLPALREQYIATGKVRMVMMDFPLNFHERAIPAAAAAHCAGEQGRYFKMADALFEISPRLDEEAFLSAARKLGLDLGRFQKCLPSRKTQQRISEGFRTGNRLGITGTPSFIIGPKNHDEIVTGQGIVGAQPLSVFKSAIDTLLAKNR